ncbi:hypothetical protein [Erysipelothrix anatis]|uniref:hypothetical protein n=1 Tax=Erysipelothrix anatis TaxID=2683713 RepID=UPI00135AD62A|nr:hypothetical protein [Erysipelothrix anatis]
MKSNYKKLRANLTNKGIIFAEGMSEYDFKIIEDKLNVIFPSQLKEFLSCGVPISKGFYNWKDLSNQNIEQIKQMIERPFLDILKEIENENYWCENWGEKPNDLEKAIKIYNSEYERAPKIIPFYSHRYIVGVANDKNMKILSIAGSDIICYSDNLESYLQIEFKIKEFDNSADCKNIPFWSNLIYD